MARPPSRHAIGFVLIAILVDTIGFGIIIPVTPELIMELSGEGISSAALYGGWLMFLYALVQFFSAPVLGNLSDRFGRRPVLLVSLLALGVDYVLMGFAPTLAWLFVGRFVAGVAGATFATANAYVADVSAPDDRAKNFGLIGAAWGLGFILGPVVGGLLGEYGSRVPFFAAAALSLANVAYGWFVLPETLSREERRPFSVARANPIGALGQMRRYPVVIGLFAAMICYQIAHDANPSSWTYFTMLQFDWSERDVGWSMGFLGLLIVIVQGGLIGKIIERFGAERTVYLGYITMAVGYLGFALSPVGWVMYVFMVPFALGSVASPAMRGILANQVPDNTQGELQGAITSLVSLTAIVAPLLMTRLFHAFTAEGAWLHFPGAPFFAASVFTLFAVAIFARIMFSAGVVRDVAGAAEVAAAE